VWGPGRGLEERIVQLELGMRLLFFLSQFFFRLDLKLLIAPAGWSFLLSNSCKKLHLATMVRYNFINRILLHLHLFYLYLPFFSQAYFFFCELDL